LKIVDLLNNSKHTQAVPKSTIQQYLACLHDQNKSGILEGRLLNSQSEQFEKFSKRPDWLKKAGPPKKPLLF